MFAGNQFTASQIVDFEKGGFVDIIAPADGRNGIPSFDNMSCVARGGYTVQTGKVGLSYRLAANRNLDIIMFLV